MGEPRDTELLRSILEAAHDGVVVNEVDSLRVVAVNAAACEMYGYTEAEFVGLDAPVLAVDAEMARAALREHVAWIPLRHHRKKDGTVFPVEIAAGELILDGRPVRVAHIRDITHRLTAEAAHRASEEKFQTAFMTSPDSININRLADGLYIEINDGFTGMTGYAADDVRGKTSADIGIWVDPADRQRLADGLRREGYVRNLEAPFRRKDGTTMWGSMSARLIDIDGESCLISVTRDITGRLIAEEALRASNQRLEGMVKDVAEAMGRIVESRDPYTQGHQERVSILSGLIAREMGTSEGTAAVIEMAALVHDVGKLAVPAEILNKPGKLSAIEFSLTKIHSERGYEILKGLDFGAPIAGIVLQHHERMDGSGYPAGLSGDEICPEARILLVADVVEAMASYRPYRPAVGLEPALEEIGSGAKYDADVVSACLALHARGALEFLREPAYRGE